MHLTFRLLHDVNDLAKSGDVETKAEILITATWPDNNEDDIDLYVQDPTGNVVWYHAMAQGLVTLDRDDRGTYLDEVTINGNKISIPLNQETVSVRGLVPGEYIVNIYEFTDPEKAPVPVTVKVEKVNPRLSVVFYDTLILNKQNDEKTAVRFTIDDAGNVVDINTRPTSLIQAVRK